jgi:hypothetical protein
LANERALVAGIGMLLTDGGANNGLTASIDNNVVATLTGSLFTGPVNASGGLTGSLQRLSSGETAFAGQGGVVITTGSNGQVIISGSASQNPSAGTGIIVIGSIVGINDNVVATLSGSIFSGIIQAAGGISGSFQRLTTGETAFAGQGGITVTTGTNGQVLISGSVPQNPLAGDGINVIGSIVSVDPNVVMMRSGSAMTGPLILSGGLTGSLQQTIQGLSYLVGGVAITITSQSNGQIIISAREFADVSASYVVIGVTGSLPNERQLTPGTGMILFDSGPGGLSTLGINDDVVATISGTRFTGPVIATGGLTGSLQRLFSGETAFAGQGGVTITTSSIGQVLISGSSPQNPTAGTGINVIGSTVSVDPNVVVMRSGSAMSGPLILSGGLTGSLQRTIEGLSYVVGAGTVSIISQSNGQIIVSGSGADSFAAYLVVSNTASLPNERALVAGTGILLTDGGANTGLTASINDNVIATLSGSKFSGPTSYSSEINLGNASGSITANFSGSQALKTTFTSATPVVTLAFPGVGWYQLKAIQDGSGSRIPTYAVSGGTVYKASGFVLSTTASAVDFITAYYDGTDVWLVVATAFA